jgi:undecaprenyl-diphosphatase
LPYDILIAGIWGTTFCVLGYIFWRNFSDVTRLAGRGALALGVLILLIVLAVRAVRRLRDPRERERWKQWIELQAKRPLLRPFAAVIRRTWIVVLRPVWLVTRPPLRFLIGRVTPGNLGIELTTLLAVAAVSVYVIFLQVDLLETVRLIAGDTAAFDIARDTRTELFTWFNRTISFLGRGGVVGLVIIGMAGFLLGRRRRVEMVMLVSAFLSTELGVQILKRTVERGRPGGGLTDADGFGYPSGHAAVSIVYLAIAVLLARSARTAQARIAFLTAGFVLAVLIGLSRVYLHVHYLSDVIGGWAVGLTAFSLIGAIALIVDYLLHPDDPRPASAAARERQPDTGADRR